MGTTIKTALRQNHMPLRRFASLRGKLRHACLGIPEGAVLMRPFDRAHTQAVRNNLKAVQIRPSSELARALKDFHQLLLAKQKAPTLCSLLIPQPPHYIGYIDACKSGVGGVLLGGHNQLAPIVWRIPFPPDIQTRVLSQENPSGTITINDLEMAGFLFATMILELLITDLHHTHVAIWCDNTSAVSWTRKLRSLKSRVGHRLVWALCMRLENNRMSPIAPLNIPGATNTMADIASRSWTSLVPPSCTSQHGFLTYFNQKFPLALGAYWRLFSLSKNLTTMVFSELLNKPLSAESWRRLGRKNNEIGMLGSPSARALTWTPSCDIATPPKPSTNSRHLLNGSGQVPSTHSHIHTWGSLTRWRFLGSPAGLPSGLKSR